MEESTLATMEVSLSDDSSFQQNASIAFGYYCWEIEADAPQFNYYYTKLKGTQKNWYYTKSKTFLTQTLMSLWLRDQPYHKALSQSCLVIPNLWGPLQVTLNQTKSSQCKTWELPEFDETGTSNLLLVLFFDNDNVKYDIILSTNLLSKTGFRSNYSEGTWNGLITPSHFVHLEVWIQPNSMLWNACSTSKSKTNSLVKIDSNALQQRFWTPCMKRQM